MEAEIRSQFSPVVLDEVASRYGIETSGLRAMDGFESFVYQCTHDGKPRILKISHSLRRSAEQIAGEIDWIRHLAENGVTACPAVPSLGGRLLETLPSDSGYFTAVVFSMAPGRPADGDEWRSSLFERMGRMMGQMHQLSRTYTPASALWRRPEWHEETAGLAEKFLAPDQQAIIDKFNASQSETHALSKDPETYGLIHCDFHRGNFFVSNGAIHLFDFDDCQYSWFADDIAIALFYAVPHDCSSPAELAFAETFMNHFLAGYRQHNQIGSDWTSRIPMFLKRREVDLYTIIHRSLELNHLDPWPSSFMHNRDFRLANDVPYVDIDFSVL